MRMTKRTAAEIIGNFSSWEGKFSWLSSVVQASSNDGGTSKATTSSLEADNKKLINTINSLQGSMKQMKSQASAQAATMKQQGGGKGKGQHKEPYGEDRVHIKRVWEPKYPGSGSSGGGGGSRKSRKGGGRK